MNLEAPEDVPIIRGVVEVDFENMNLAVSLKL
jgi:hypothetical protein